MKLNKKLLFNVKKPQNNILGKIQLSGMNKRHNDLTLWGLSHIKLADKKSILDIGCGGGKNIENLLKFAPDAVVYGVDYSSASVKASIKLNKEAVKVGKVKVVCSDVKSMPFASQSFELITAFETIYFWQDMKKAFDEVYRVLKKDGSFVICNESKKREGLEGHIELLQMEIYSAEQIKEYLLNAGFGDIQVDEHTNGKWLYVRACK